MKTKFLGLAAIGLGCSIGVAAAQGLPPNPQATLGPSPEKIQQVLNGLAKQRAAMGLTAGASYSFAKPDIDNLSAANVPTGWNTGHAWNCGWFTPNGSDQWFYVFPLEGGIWFTINSVPTAQGLAVSCANGNLEGVFVVNPNGTFTQTFSFPFR
jgi:hypothetical protein